MHHLLRRGLCLLVVTLLASCTALPRGAAVETEILQEPTDASATFQVVEVTRDLLPALKSWPLPPNQLSFHWIDTSRGPASTIIRTGDHLDITVWDNQENSLITGPSANSVSLPRMAVSASGAVFVPYVGEVIVQGLTADQARRDIQTQLSSIAPDAQVQVSVASGVQNSVSFVAGVNAPGSYPLPDRNTSILSGIALAGGISPALRNPSVTLVRDGTTYQIAATDLFEFAQKNTRLRGGDEVIVQEDKRSFTALGASGVEDIIYFPKPTLTALEAISLMGGVNDTRADPRAILVLREFAQSQIRSDGNGPSQADVVYTINLTSADGLFAARNFTIAPNDTLLVTESPVTGVRTVIEILGDFFGITARATTLAQ